MSYKVTKSDRAFVCNLDYYPNSPLYSTGQASLVPGRKKVLFEFVISCSSNSQSLTISKVKIPREDKASLI